METEIFLQQFFNEEEAHDMDQMQSFCFDLKVHILHYEVTTSVYVCKYSLISYTFLFPYLPRRNTHLLRGVESVYLSDMF